jgi:hypothetical protein
MHTFLDVMPMTNKKMITPNPDRSITHQLSDRVSANTDQETRPAGWAGSTAAGSR